MSKYLPIGLSIGLQYKQNLYNDMSYSTLRAEDEKKRYKEEIIKELCLENGVIDLSNLNFAGYVVNADGLIANIIINEKQEANIISNSNQLGKVIIDNSYQTSRTTIDNRCQRTETLDERDKISNKIIT